MKRILLAMILVVGALLVGCNNPSAPAVATIHATSNTPMSVKVRYIGDSNGALELGTTPVVARVRPGEAMIYFTRPRTAVVVRKLTLVPGGHHDVSVNHSD